MIHSHSQQGAIAIRIASRFAVAVHILSLLGMNEQDENTSEWMAGSIGVNAVVVRNVTGQLRRAGLVRTQQGVAGAHLDKALGEITLLDVYRAVEESVDLFSIHPRPNPDCSVGANIQTSLEGVFGEAQQAMENRLSQTTMAQIVQDLRASAQC
ncbi:transcriptional regulator [Capsulimonas corticalis]|uniref:Transcriptional regulator n=1 Tax=Capsulimonas corticalis TaxID=2219043 RepID=A0A402CSI4_9BACT|nr:Rrf2 family transcriptional regulator [Capsulimonas corticalis]BDI31067.1 transcriptional regulator [Capsulimonas corticalis]